MFPFGNLYIPGWLCVTTYCCYVHYSKATHKVGEPRKLIQLGQAYEWQTLVDIGYSGFMMGNHGGSTKQQQEEQKEGAPEPNVSVPNVSEPTILVVVHIPASRLFGSCFGCEEPRTKNIWPHMLLAG